MQYFHLLLILLFGAFRKSVNLTLHESRDESCDENLIQTYQQTTFLSLNCQNDLKTELMCAKKRINEAVKVKKIVTYNCEIFNTTNGLELLRELNITQAGIEMYYNKDYKEEKINNIDHGVEYLEISTKINKIHYNFLQNYQNVSELKLRFFNLQKVPKKMFDNLKKLKDLGWYNRNTTVFQRADIEELSELKTISITFGVGISNSCEKFPLNFSNMTNMKTIWLISTFGSCIASHLFKGSTNLEYIQINWNKHLKELPDQIFEDQINLINLVLKGNGFKNVKDVLFVNLRKLRYLNLSGNNIKEVKWVSPLLPNMETVDLTRNSDISFYIQLNSTNFKTIECDRPKSKLYNFNSDGFLCYTEEMCEFINDRNNITCPEHCECHLNRETWDFEVNCTNSNFTDFPQIPMPNIGNVTVHLEDNHLKMLPNMNLYGYKNIVHLYVSGNELLSLSLEQLPPNITHLDLSNNKLTTIKWEVLNFLENYVKFESLFLAKNPWLCECDLTPLLGFIEKLHKKVLDSDHIRCRSNNMIKSLIQMKQDELCPSNWTLIISLIIAVIMLFLIFVIIYLCNRQFINVWLYEHNCCMPFITEELLDKNMLFDAFISYSSKDIDILPQFVDRLEKCPDPFKLCIHDRNWLAGDCITERIARTVEHSKRVIIILSQNFLESTWGLMEFRLAYQACIQQKRRRLIVVLYNEPDNYDNLESELRDYLLLNTYIRWNDPNFWRKLRYAMPHLKPHVRGTPRNEQNEELKLEYIM